VWISINKEVNIYVLQYSGQQHILVCKCNAYDIGAEQDLFLLMFFNLYLYVCFVW